MLGERGTIDVNSLPKSVTRQRRGCDLNPRPSAPESSMLTTRLPSHPNLEVGQQQCCIQFAFRTNAVTEDVISAFSPD